MIPYLKVCLVVSLLIALSGCVWQAPAPTPTSQPGPTPTECEKIYIQSNCLDCRGDIIVNDVNTGVELYPFGAALVTFQGLRCGDIVRVNLMNSAGVKSHTAVTMASSPQSIITFNWFLHFPGYRL